MTADIQTFVDEIAARAKVDPDAAETAVGTILLLFNKKAMRPKWLSFPAVSRRSGACPEASSRSWFWRRNSGTLSGVAKKVVGGDASKS